MEGRIALVVVAMQEHERPLAAETTAERMDGSQRPVTVQGRLTSQGPAVTGEGIVQAGMEERRARKRIAAIEGRRGRGGVRDERAVEVGVEHIDAERCQPPKGSSPPGETGPQVSEVRIVLLRQFGLCAMIAVGDDGTGSAVLVEGGIQRAVRSKSRHPPVVSQPPRSSNTTQIAIGRPRGMSRQHMAAASLRLKHRQLAQVETRIHDQSHAHLHPEHAQVQFLEPTHATQLEVIGIVVVAPVVATREERFASILGSRQSELESVAVVELIAQVVTIAVASIAVLVALALIEGNLQGSLQRVTALLEKGGEWREERCGRRKRFATDEADQQAAGVPVEALYHQQFVETPHGFVAVPVGNEFLNLRGREERKLFQFLAGGLVEVQLVVGQASQEFEGLLTVGSILESHPVAEELLPGRGRSGRRNRDGGGRRLRHGRSGQDEGEEE